MILNDSDIAMYHDVEEILAKAPERFLSGAGRKSLNTSFQTLEEAKGAFDVLELALQRIGPQGSPEQYVLLDDIWLEPRFQAFLKDLNVREYNDRERVLATFERWAAKGTPRELFGSGPALTWPGLFREWVRLSVVVFAKDALHGIHKRAAAEARSFLLGKVPELILLLDDGARASWLFFYFVILQDEALPLVLEVYHHPTSGHRTRRVIESEYSKEEMAYILSHAPATHRTPPWKPRE